MNEEYDSIVLNTDDRSYLNKIDPTEVSPNFQKLLDTFRVTEDPNLKPGEWYMMASGLIVPYQRPEYKDEDMQHNYIMWERYGMSLLDDPIAEPSTPIYDTDKTNTFEL